MPKLQEMLRGYEDIFHKLAVNHLLERYGEKQVTEDKSALIDQLVVSINATKELKTEDYRDELKPLIELVFKSFVDNTAQKDQVASIKMKCNEFTTLINDKKKALAEEKRLEKMPKVQQKLGKYNQIFQETGLYHLLESHGEEKVTGDKLSSINELINAIAATKGLEAKDYKDELKPLIELVFKSFVDNTAQKDQVASIKMKCNEFTTLINDKKKTRAEEEENLLLQTILPKFKNTWHELKKENALKQITTGSERPKGVSLESCENITLQDLLIEIKKLSKKPLSELLKSDLKDASPRLRAMTNAYKESLNLVCLDIKSPKNNLDEEDINFIYSDSIDIQLKTELSTSVLNARIRNKGPIEAKRKLKSIHFSGETSEGVWIKDSRLKIALVLAAFDLPTRDDIPHTVFDKMMLEKINLLLTFLGEDISIALKESCSQSLEYLLTELARQKPERILEFISQITPPLLNSVQFAKITSAVKKHNTDGDVNSLLEPFYRIAEETLSDSPWLMMDDGKTLLEACETSDSELVKIYYNAGYFSGLCHLEKKNRDELGAFLKKVFRKLKESKSLTEGLGEISRLKDNREIAKAFIDKNLATELDKKIPPKFNDEYSELMERLNSISCHKHQMAKYTSTIIGRRQITDEEGNINITIIMKKHLDEMPVLVTSVEDVNELLRLNKAANENQSTISEIFLQEHFIWGEDVDSDDISRLDHPHFHTTSIKSQASWLGDLVTQYPTLNKIAVMGCRTAAFDEKKLEARETGQGWDAGRALAREKKTSYTTPFDDHAKTQRQETEFSEADVSKEQDPAEHNLKMGGTLLEKYFHRGSPLYYTAEQIHQKIKGTERVIQIKAVPTNAFGIHGRYLAEGGKDKGYGHTYKQHQTDDVKSKASRQEDIKEMYHSSSSHRLAFKSVAVQVKGADENFMVADFDPEIETREKQKRMSGADTVRTKAATELTKEDLRVKNAILHHTSKKASAARKRSGFLQEKDHTEQREEVNEKLGTSPKKPKFGGKVN